MSEKITHEKIVLDLLKKGKQVDCWTMPTKYGITRLSAIIYKLRQKLKKEGYEIATITHISKNQYGNTSQWAEYVLVQKGE